MAAGQFNLADKRISTRMERTRDKSRNGSASPKGVPIQVMVPESVRRQLALMGADRGENMRTVVLRGLRAIGIQIPESELADRRGRRRARVGGGNGAK